MIFKNRIREAINENNLFGGRMLKTVLSAAEPI